jgi:transposase
VAQVDPEAASEALRLFSERREDLVAERTRALNRLHALLRDVVPGGVARALSAYRAARILRGIRPKGTSARLRRRLASEVLRDVRTLDRKIADLNRRIEAEVEASGTTLTRIFSRGPILAARIISTVGDVGRFPTKAHFASYAGTAPLEASSDEVVRHRLSLAGNRHLNYALHMVAVCQARSDARGGAYYRKKIAEGKSRKEALRCLKRRVCDAGVTFVTVNLYPRLPEVVVAFAAHPGLAGPKTVSMSAHMQDPGCDFPRIPLPGSLPI